MPTIQRLMQMGFFYQRPSQQIIIESAPPFSFDAIIKIEGDISDGQIITFLDPFYSQLLGLIEKNPEIIHQIDCRKMEEIVAAAYSKERCDAEQDAPKAIFTTTAYFAPRIKTDRLLKPYFKDGLELNDKDKVLARLNFIGENGRRI